MENLVVGNQAEKQILQVWGLLHLYCSSAVKPGRLGSGGFGQADGAGNLA
jgi:hypothetical protein